MGGSVSAGGQEKEWTGCLLDDLGGFGIDPEGEWHRTAKEGEELFMTKWIVVERARAASWHAEICQNVTERIKEMVAHSKRARTGLLEAVG